MLNLKMQILTYVYYDYILCILLTFLIHPIVQI